LLLNNIFFSVTEHFLSIFFPHSEAIFFKLKWLSGEALQIAEERREMKGKGEMERYTQLNAEFQRIARRDKKRS